MWGDARSLLPPPPPTRRAPDARGPKCPPAPAPTPGTRRERRPRETPVLRPGVVGGAALGRGPRLMGAEGPWEPETQAATPD